MSYMFNSAKDIVNWGKLHDYNLTLKGVIVYNSITGEILDIQEIGAESLENSLFANICKPLSNGTWVINKGSKDGVCKGYVYSVPDGNPEPLYDPVTDELLGHHQFEIARLVVVTAYDKYSFCHALNSSDPDRVPQENIRKSFHEYEYNVHQYKDDEFTYVGTQVKRVLSGA